MLNVFSSSFRSVDTQTMVDDCVVIQFFLTMFSYLQDTALALQVRDNDSLAARLACELKSDLLLLISDVDGVYTAPPGSPGARFVAEYEVTKNPEYDTHSPLVNGEFLNFGEASSVGTGGMKSKIASAVWAVRQVR